MQEAQAVYKKYQEKLAKHMESGCAWNKGQREDLMYRQVGVEFPDWATCYGTVALRTSREDCPYVVFFQDGLLQSYSKVDIQKSLMPLPEVPKKK